MNVQNLSNRGSVDPRARISTHVIPGITRSNGLVPRECQHSDGPLISFNRDFFWLVKLQGWKKSRCVVSSMQNPTHSILYHRVPSPCAPCSRAPPLRLCRRAPRGHLACPLRRATCPLHSPPRWPWPLSAARTTSPSPHQPTCCVTVHPAAALATSPCLRHRTRHPCCRAPRSCTRHFAVPIAAAWAAHLAATTTTTAATPQRRNYHDRRFLAYVELLYPSTILEISIESY
jgi:hypothetical protein